MPKLRTLVILCISCCTVFVADAKKSVKPVADSTYITSYTNDLTLRVFASNKFNQLRFGDYDNKDKVLYKPNASYNIGLGFNYRWLGLNFGFATPGLNNDNDKYGRTRRQDVQAIIYQRTMTLNVYLQNFEGYYLANNDILQTPPAGDLNIIRSDIHTQHFGLTVDKVLNGRKFSFKSVYAQNEWQKKSSGSVIVGAAFHYMNIHADSSLIPSDINYPVFAENQQFNRSYGGYLGVHGGYAHTFVIKEHFFVMGSLLAGGGINYTKLENEATGWDKARLGFQLNGTLRLGMGYNSERNYVGLYFITNLDHRSLPLENAYQQYETGLIRLAFSRRFTLKPKVARPINAVLGVFEFGKKKKG